MHSINEFQNLINRAVAEKQYTGTPEELYEPINYIMGLGGKRMRPVLMLMACKLFSDDISKAIKPALGIEVFHNFTLMHDDIMDNAPLRRNKPTVHKKWNESVAILSGDVMLIEAYKLMMQVEPDILPQVLELFNATAASVCEGQQIDINFEKKEGVSVDEYISMIRLKTSVLLGCALKTGGLIGGADETNAGFLYDFGITLGIAFQLQDDILDVYGNPEKFGKQVGGDIIANKKTFLLIKAKELAVGTDAENLQNWMVSTDNPINKVEAVTAIYNKLEIRRLAENEMSRYAEKAWDILSNVSVNSLKIQALKTFAEQLLVRQS